MSEPTPVILDTDIGDDIDDMWALIMMLRCPELDVRLVTTAHKDVTIRAKLVAKLLEIADRTDVPVGIGTRKPSHVEHRRPFQAEWVDDYDLESYPGMIHEDGAAAICETIHATDIPVTLIATGPLPTTAAALRQDPSITAKSRFVGMHGSIYKGYDGGPTPVAEANVRKHTPDCQYVLASDWEKTITPLDTCGLVRIEGADYQRIRTSRDPVLQALMANNRLYAANAPWVEDYDPAEHSSTLFDTVAVYLAFSEEFLRIDTLPIVVTEDGFTRVDDAGDLVRTAIEWDDLSAFKRLLVRRILAED